MADLLQHIGIWSGLAALAVRELQRTGIILRNDRNNGNGIKPLQELQFKDMLREGGREIVESVAVATREQNSQIIHLLETGVEKTDEVRLAIVDLASTFKARKR